MESIGVLLIVAGVIAMAIVIGVIIGRFKVSSPNEALIVSGSQSKNAKDIVAEARVVLGGGRIFVMPFVQRLFRISLESHKINLEVTEAVTENNIIVNLNGVAMVKVGGNEDNVRDAAQRFLGQQEQIRTYAQEVMEGSLRSIVGTMTVENIIRDRAKFANEVAESAVKELRAQGLMLDTLTVQSVVTPSGYIENLGRPEAAKVARAASIAEAEAMRDSETAQAMADQAIADEKRNLALRLAAIKSETSDAEARAAAAGPIAEAERQTEILEKERIAAEKRAEVTEQELESTVRKPADAEAYRVRVEAEAAQVAYVAEATARADAVRLEGQADADAIEARGRAEGKAIAARAQAYADYPQAGVFQMAMEGVPAIARAVAEPIGEIDNLTVVSTDGANKITQTATDLITQTGGVIESLTGFNIGDLANNALGGTTPPKVTPADLLRDEKSKRAQTTKEENNG